MATTSQKIISGFLVILGFLALLPLMIVYQAWVLCYLWVWFLVPLGLRPITIPLACGVMTLVHFVVPPRYNDKDSPETRIITALALPIFTLGVGYVIHLWM